MSDFVKGIIKIIIILAIIIIMLIILANLFNKRETPKTTVKKGLQPIADVTKKKNNNTTNNDSTTSDSLDEINTGMEVTAPDTAASDYLTPLLGIIVLSSGTYCIYKYRKENA